MSMQQEGWPRALRSSAFATSGPTDAGTVDQVGDAILALLQKAANAAKDDHDQALAMVHELSLKLRAAEDRVEKLEDRIEQLEGENRRADDWLAAIHKEIETKFLQQRDISRQQLPVFR